MRLQGRLLATILCTRGSRQISWRNPLQVRTRGPKGSRLAGRGVPPSARQK